MRPARILSIIGVLLLILVAVMCPIIYSGHHDLNAATSANTEKRYAEASQLYESAARLLFWKNDLWGVAAVASMKDGNYPEAIRLFEIARQKRELSAGNWELLGSIYWLSDNHPMAISTWIDGLKADPSDVVLYDRLAMVYHDQGDYASEQNFLVKRLSLAADANAHYQLGLLLMLSDTNMALKEFTTASSMDPQFD